MFVSHHTLKWTRTCRSHGRHPHAHTAHFLLNRHNTGAGRAARVKRVKPIPEPLVRAAKTYADEARRLGASLDDAFNALCAQW